MDLFDFRQFVKKYYKNSGFELHYAKYEKIDEEKCKLYFEITKITKNNEEFYLEGNIHEIQAKCGCTDKLFYLPSIIPVIRVEKLENNLLVNIVDFSLNFKKEEVYRELTIKDINVEVLNG